MKKIQMIDKNGNEIHVKDYVIMPNPDINDMWLYGEFSACVIEIDIENGYLIVEDGDGDCWTVEPIRVELEE